jgi:hypothetical protein
MANNEPTDETLGRMLSEVDPDHDPAPDELIRISEALFIWKSIEADLATLEVSGDTALSRVRGTVASTSCSYTLDGDEEGIEVEYFGSDHLLVVDLAGSSAISVAVWRLDVTSTEVPEGVETAEPDEARVCRLADVAPGPVFFVFQRADRSLDKTGPLLLA